MDAAVSTKDGITRMRLQGMAVEAECVGTDSQPWGGADAFKYRVVLNVDGHERWETFAWGSQVDHERGDNTRAEEMAWMVLDELLGAYWDSDEFFQMAMGEDGDEERARKLIAYIDYAESIAEALQLNEEAIREAQE